MIIISPEIIKQKNELKNLEKQYQELILQKDEILNEIEEFNYEYNIKFENLLNKILNLREENIYKKIELYKLKKNKLLENDTILKSLEEKKYKLQAKIDKINLELKLNNNTNIALKEELRIELSEINSQIEFIKKEKEKFQKEEDIRNLEEELFEAKEEKQEYKKEIDELEKIEKLNDEETKELKLIYKKLSKLIHPDMVEEKYKNEANILMAKLNFLYKLKKLSEIKKIYAEIKDKNFIFISDNINEENLQEELKKMKVKITKLQQEINEIKKSEIFEIIENKENYFKEVEESLNQRLNDLKIEKSYIDINIAKYKEFKV